jgi:hypothetical protein
MNARTIPTPTDPTLSHLFIRHCLGLYQAQLDRVRDLIEQHEYRKAYDLVRCDSFTPYEEFWAAFESIPEIAAREEGELQAKDGSLELWRSNRAKAMATFLSTMTTTDLKRLTP